MAKRENSEFETLNKMATEASHVNIWKLKKKLTRCRMHLSFNKECIERKLVPRFIYNKHKINEFKIAKPLIRREIKKLEKTEQILNSTLNDYSNNRG